MSKFIIESLRAIVDGTHVVNPKSAVEDAIEYIEMLEEAVSGAEIAHGLTSDGNLWRFWAEKARHTAAENARLRSLLKQNREMALAALKLMDVTDES